jgi:hypothetical protein
MKTKTNILDRQNTILSLLNRQCADNAEALKVADELKTLLFLVEMMHNECYSNPEYNGTVEFFKSHATIDAIKINLIKLISNL